MMKSNSLDVYSKIDQFVGDRVYEATDSELLAFIAYVGADVFSRAAANLLQDMFQGWLRSLDSQPRTATIQYGFTPIYQGYSQTGVF